MKFVYPWMLALVAFVPVAGALWAFLRARSERRLAAFVAPGLQARLLPRSPRLFSLQAALLLAGLALVLFAAARPQWGQSAQQMQARSRNVVIALDVSRSMLAADIRPNRLERAKADLADLVRSLEGDRCALVVFRRTGELLCPLTTDYAFLRSAIEGASPDSAPRGETDLGSAIRKSLDALNPAKDEHNAIILISDGGDLRGGAIEAARLAKKRSVPVFTVGLGNDKMDSAVPDASGTGAQTYKGQAVKTRLDNKTLETIARESGGRYVPLATAGTAETTLGAIYRRFLRQVAEEDIAEEEELRATERFGWFLVPGIFLVLLAALFSRGRFAGRRARAVAAAALLVLCFGVHADETAATNSAPTSADEVQLTDGEVWNKGVDYYRAGDTTNALATLRPLMLRRTHGARAAEVVGAIRHVDSARALAQAKDAQGVQAENAALEPMRRALAAGEESAWAMQIALRAAPEDPRVNRNFTRVTDGLNDLRKELHVAEVLAAAKGRDPKAQMAEAARDALALLRELGRRGFHRAVDTTLYAAPDVVRAVAAASELLLIDLKHMDSAAHRRYTGVPNEPILDNIRLVAEMGVSYFIRIPLIDGVNADPANCDAVVRFLTSLPNRPDEVTLLPYHDIGKGKHDRLGTTYNPDDLPMAPPSEALLAAWREKMRNCTTS